MPAAHPPEESLLADWLARLEALSPYEIDMGLERVERVLGRLDLAAPATVLHVAGTNGKGSCVAMLESLLLAGGRHVGSYTSPHVLRYNERIRIGGREADDAAIIAAFERVESVRDGELLTYFEFGTLAALAVFAAAGVDVVLLEIGMGGRLDAVNAVEPVAGLITNVTLDHSDWLGDDVETIAAEKAGIMRRGKPLVFGDREVPAAIREQARSTGADLWLPGRDYDWGRSGDGWHWRGAAAACAGLVLPALPGRHQLANAAAVLALLEAAGFDALLGPKTVNACLAGVRVTGRMQRIDDGRTWLLDAAHNPAAARALADVLGDDPDAGRTVAILGVLDDKDVAGIVTPLADVVDDWIAVTAHSSRAIPAGELARQVANQCDCGCLIAASASEAILRARAITGGEDLIVVTGSFYLVGPVLAELYSQPVKCWNEL